ncbi:hypothetical protein BGZ82_003557 [Podila clonocystis]|nr:hypothetical protein BGZ82_003557 [Podila clonocystis]
MVRCSDNTSYHGDILVGADGAYSAVRQNLYKSLKIDKKLPASDDVDLPFSCESAKRNDSFRNSEWGPEAAEALASEVRVFKVPGGKDGKVLTLGEYVDRTPKHLMSKVMLEEIVFDTWYGGRTVLLGDACHKMNPSGGVGGIHAIHDAVALANWLSTLQVPGDKQIAKVFKEYQTERYPVAKTAFETSRMFTHDNAPVKPLYQRSLHKTLAIHQELAKPAVVATESSAPVTI